MLFETRILFNDPRRTPLHQIRFLFFLLVFCGMRAQTALAQGVPERLVIGRLPCASGENPRAHGVRQLAWEAMKRTNLEVEMDSIEVDPKRSDLFRTPFLVWSCAGAVKELGEKEIENLRRFLTLGGMLWVDDPSGSPGSPFDQSARRMLNRIFPDQALSILPPDHVLYRTFFMLSGAIGRRAVKPYLEVVQLQDRAAILFSLNDLLGAMSRDFFGGYEYSCEPGGEEQREKSFRLGINLLMYAMCLDYKDDRVHLPFILKRRRL
jgi:hypothetical protein